MKKGLPALLLMLLFFVPIFLNLREGQSSGRFWDGEDGRYVLRGDPAFDAAVFNRKLLLVSIPLLIGFAYLKNR